MRCMAATVLALALAMAPVTGCKTLKGFGSTVTENGSTVKEAGQDLLGQLLNAGKMILAAAPDFLIKTLGVDDEEVPTD